jgi:hypothetical protein
MGNDPRSVRAIPPALLKKSRPRRSHASGGLIASGSPVPAPFGESAVISAGDYRLGAPGLVGVLPGLAAGLLAVTGLAGCDLLTGFLSWFMDLDPSMGSLPWAAFGENGKQ